MPEIETWNNLVVHLLDVIERQQLLINDCVQAIAECGGLTADFVDEVAKQQDIFKDRLHKVYQSVAGTEEAHE